MTDVYAKRKNLRNRLTDREGSEFRGMVDRRF